MSLFADVRKGKKEKKKNKEFTSKKMDGTGSLSLNIKKKGL